MKKQTPKTDQPVSVEDRQQKPPIDLESLTPFERTRLDAAVMALVEYLVAVSAKAA